MPPIKENGRAKLDAANANAAAMISRIRGELIFEEKSYELAVSREMFVGGRVQDF